LSPLPAPPRTRPDSRRQQHKLRGTVENALGLREFCDKKGWDLVVTADKEGPDSAFAKEIETAE
jgi:formate dehydrogenase